VVAFPVLAVAVTGFLARRLRVDGKALQESLRTGTLAMMAMTLWILLPRGTIDPFLLALALLSFGLAAFTKVNPLWAILGAGFLNAGFKAIFH
jgi:chromate transporter